MKALNAGNLRHPITIQAPSYTQNATGEKVVSWSTFASVWASIEPLAGKELELARALGQVSTHKVTLRYLSGLTVQHRIQYGARQFSIQNINNIEERNYTLQLTCAEWSKQ